MSTVYKFVRILVLLWATALLWFQSDEIKDLRHEQTFWVGVAYETAHQAIRIAEECQ